MKIVAHRGLRGLKVKGNSIKAIKNAIKNGAEIIELDIQKAKKNLILRHDIKTGFFKQIKEFNFKGKRVVKLDNALNIIPNSMPLIADIKLAGIEDEVIKKLKGRNVIYFSHLPDVLKKIKKIDKKAMVGVYYLPKITIRSFLRRLYFVNTFIKRAKELKVDIIAIPGAFLTKKFVKEMKKNKLKTYVYGFMFKRGIRNAIKLNVEGIEVDLIKDVHYIQNFLEKSFGKKS